jgi:hypothetical protein
MALARLQAKRHLIDDLGWTEEEWIRFTLWLVKHGIRPLNTPEDWVRVAKEWAR